MSSEAELALFLALGFAVTTGPLTRGPTLWGTSPTSITRGPVSGNINQSAIAPTYSCGSIARGGYTTTVVQCAQNPPGGNGTLREAQVGTNGSEQTTYTFLYGLPVAPSLAYGAFKLANIPPLAAWQYTAINFARASYLTVYQTKANVENWTTIAASATPTPAASWVGTVTCAGSQWDSISTAPGLFSNGGRLYHWYVFISVILGGIGMSSASVVQRQRAIEVR